jgi:hypothetical protein
VSVVKCSNIPMLVCDEAFRADPEQVDFMHVLNTLHLKDHPTLLYLANSLDLVKQQKAVFQGRHDFAGYMVQHANAVVAHQWQNDQNYNYLDALYGNYPLIHNSPWLRMRVFGLLLPRFRHRRRRPANCCWPPGMTTQLDHFRSQAARVIRRPSILFRTATCKTTPEGCSASFPDHGGVGVAA